MRKRYLVILVIVLILSFAGCSKSSTNIKTYLNSGAKIDTYAKDCMPAIDDLPKYRDISYKYNYVSTIMFETETITLNISYDEETYENEKKKLTEKYKFLNQKFVSNFDESKYYIPEYEFSMNSYNFKVVDQNGDYKAEYPKSFCIIGTSDEKKSVAYLYFYDFDLDYIEEYGDNPMANFVQKYFKYDF
ncbi:hypothetical protein [Clostridium chromiireducens]|uniref:Lipoprotein n=1 Tax=Clostridium chromiireducens TaxID=225345 RepID=A0A1V4J0H5_9CLOT|nr:hypothetical protein [Clostridium chromiireducens]OPJ65821.1 hypothetical protein CLCHR_03940 [Clostridium chromiireducens]RII36725.1 hypothetical protein D2A34_04905 [Clostridium chromiireducens]